MAAEPTILWLTDRSRYLEGLDRCMRSRFLNFHSGPSGYGIQKKAAAIPLAAGSYVHVGIQRVLEYCKATDQLPPDTTVRAAVEEAIGEYNRVVSLRGMRGMDEGQRLEDLIREQQYLIAGLIWTFVLSTLPYIMDLCRILEVEREELLVAGCTCGLGDRIGSLEDHEGRGCEGIGFQSKPDFITEYRLRPGVLAYWELKTLGAVNEPWESQWETAMQFPAGAMGASARLERPIAEGYIVGLIKGRREGDTYNPDTRKREGELRQQSVLCYGYYKAGNPPLELEDWQPQWNYKDEGGKGHTLGKAYQKRGIWGLKDAAGEVSVPEFWAKWLEPDVLAKSITLIGPIQINQVQQAEIVEEWVAEETKWKGIVWELYQVLSENGFDWTSAPYQAALRRLVPRSWSCRRYGKRHECQFTNLCFSHEGWQDPIGSGIYVDRRPHHDPELRQVEARGLLPEGGWTDEQEVGD